MLSFQDLQIQRQNSQESSFYDAPLLQDLEYGRVLLCFSILIQGHLGKWFEKDLAFVQYFDHYKVKGKQVTTNSKHVSAHTV